MAITFFGSLNSIDARVNAAMLRLRERKLKKEYRMIEFEICFYTKGKWRPFYFWRHILSFLRQHPELCDESDYEALYDETVTLLILRAHVEDSWTRRNPKGQQDWVETLIDFESRYKDGRLGDFSIEIVDEYLAYRKKMWECGKRYTKARYGFIP